MDRSKTGMAETALPFGSAAGDGLEWLFAYSPMEEKLRGYYLAHGEVMPRQEPAKLNAAEEGLSPEENEGSILTEGNLIRDYSDISVIKHPRYTPPFDHTHTFFEVSYVVTGSCRHTIRGKGAEETVALARDDVLILPPGVVHSILTDGDSVVINILLRRSTFESAFLHNIPADSVLSDFFTKILYSRTHPSHIRFRTQGNAMVQEAFFGLVRESRRHNAYSSNILNLRLGLFFIYLIQECGRQVRFSQDYRREADTIPSIIHYMEVHFATATVGEIAQHFNYDLSHLSKLYRRHTNTTLRDTLQAIRLRNSATMLRRSGMPVDEVAAMVGYRDTSSYIRRFRLHYGVTPLQYRKGHEDASMQG